MANEKNNDLTPLSKPENLNKTVDLNVKEPDLTEDPSAAVASSGNPSTDLEKKEGDDAKRTLTAPDLAVGDNSSVSDIQKKIRRAERFGTPVLLSEEEKRNSRAERFGTGAKLPGPEGLKKLEEVKRKARAERFGLAASASPADEEAKKKARLARFGAETKVDSVEEDKRKARGIRFSKPTSGSLPQTNGKEKIDTKAAVMGNTA